MKSITKNKNFPMNSHMYFYRDWVYLGSCNKHDYYCKDNSTGDIVGSDLLLSIVCGEDPCDYISPDVNYLNRKDSHECYKTLYTLLCFNNII